MESPLNPFKIGNGNGLEQNVTLFLSTDDVDECHLVTPCQNGGFCVNNPGSFGCTCQGTGFSGTFCTGIVYLDSYLVLSPFT